jgi:hypothetical protein
VITALTSDLGQAVNECFAQVGEDAPAPPPQTLDGFISTFAGAAHHLIPAKADKDTRELSDEQFAMRAVLVFIVH